MLGLAALRAAPKLPSATPKLPNGSILTTRDVFTLYPMPSGPNDDRRLTITAATVLTIKQGASRLARNGSNGAARRGGRSNALRALDIRPKLPSAALKLPDGST